MKKLIIVVLVFSYFNLIAQNKAPNSSGDNGAAIAAVGGLAVAAIAGAIAYEQYIETLELQATQQYLRSYKGSDIFKVKLLSDQLTSLKDLSSTSVLAFGITEYEQQDNFLVKPKHRIMLMLLSHGWANEYGIDFTYVTTKVLNKEDWNELYFKYINSMAFPKFQSSREIKALIKVNEKKFNESNLMKLSMYNPAAGINEYYLDADIFIPISSNFQIKQDKIMVDKIIDVYTTETYLVATKLKIDNDTYIHSNYDNDISIIFNENKLGIYDINLKNLVQLKSKGVSAIHSFMNQIN
jgi:hypothetical protein